MKVTYTRPLSIRELAIQHAKQSFLLYKERGLHERELLAMKDGSFKYLDKSGYAVFLNPQGQLMATYIG